MASKVKGSKKLTPTNINKDQKALDDQLSVIVFSPVNDEEYELKIDKTFRKSKALKINLELINAFQFAKANNVDFELMFTQYALLLVIKHFTSFGDGMTDNIAEQIQLLGKLDDLGLLEPIIEAMPEDQLQFVFDLIEKTVDSLMGETLEGLDKLDELEAKLQESIESLQEE